MLKASYVSLSGNVLLAFTPNPQGGAPLTLGCVIHPLQGSKHALKTEERSFFRFLLRWLFDDGFFRFLSSWGVDHRFGLLKKSLCFVELFFKGCKLF